MPPIILPFNGITPQIAENAYIAPTAVIIGDVVIGAEASIWFGVVIRGDTGAIRIGAGTSIQDNSVIHVNAEADTHIGDEVTVGHGAILEGCDVRDGALIGMGAIVLSGALVHEKALVAAGAVVREGAEVAADTLAAGVPAKERGPVSEAARAVADAIPAEYRHLGARYRQQNIT